MDLKDLTILGLSEPTLTMIFDNLESRQIFPCITILNNLKIQEFNEFKNKLFNIKLIDDSEINTVAHHLFLGVNKPFSKLAVYDAFATNDDGYRRQFINIIHHSSVISSTSKLGFGVHINSLVSVAAFSKIGDFVSINRNVSIGHHTIVEDFATINPGANIAGFVRIGEKSLIGMGANILDGIHVGKNTIIGAGSVVTKDIPDNVIAYGNPCIVVRKNET